jgi:hypothetical protein
MHRNQALYLDKTRLKVKYSGESLDGGLMQVAQFAEALEGLSETLRLCGKVVSGSKTETTLAISANIRAGSFGFEVVLSHVASTAASLLPSDVVRNALDLAKLVFGEDGLLSLFKRTRGEPPSRVDHIVLEDGSVQINGPISAPVTININKNTYNTTHVVSAEQWACYERQDVREAVWGTIAPLEENGIEEVGFTTEDGDGTRVSSSEAGLFVPKKDSDDGEHDFVTYEAELTVVKQSFARGRRWNFESLQGSFGALISDPDFLARQDRREVTIRKGDRIRAIVSVRRHASERRGKKPRDPEYFIREVLEIIPPPESPPPSSNTKTMPFDF